MDGITQVATYLREVKQARHFSVLVQNRTAGGNLTWLESYVRAKTLTQSRKSGVFVSPGVKKTFLVKQCKASPSRSGGGLPVTTPACVSGLEMPLDTKGSRSEYRAWGLFGVCPGEAAWSAGTGAALLLGHAGAGDWDR